MLYCFYLTRNIIGLILVLSPLAGLLYIDSITALSMACLCSLIAALLHAEYRSGILAGWFRSGKAMLTAVVWTASLALGRLFADIMERNTYIGMAFSAASFFVGVLIFLERPSRIAGRKPEPVTADRRLSSLKIIVFSGVLGFAAAFSFLNMPANMPFDFFMSAETFFAAGILAGPAAAGLISDNKSVYAGAVFMIFIAEIAAACVSHGGNLVALMYLGHLTSGMLISGLLVIIPLLCFYISDTAGFSTRLCWSSSSACGGALVAFFVCSQYSSGPDLTVFVFGLLIISFFMLFSAWRHRLFLLKHRQI